MAFKPNDLNYIKNTISIFKYGSTLRCPKALKYRMHDFLVIINGGDDPAIEWHYESFRKWPEHYTILSKLSTNKIARLQRLIYSCPIFYNSLINSENKLIKYGVVSYDQFEKNLIHWPSSFLPGRFHKVICPLSNIPLQLLNIINLNRMQALKLSILSLLKYDYSISSEGIKLLFSDNSLKYLDKNYFLDERPNDTYEISLNNILEKIISISYYGDIRCLTNDAYKKAVTKELEGSLPYLFSVYFPLIVELSKISSGNLNLNSPNLSSIDKLKDLAKSITSALENEVTKDGLGGMNTKIKESKEWFEFHRIYNDTNPSIMCNNNPVWIKKTFESLPDNIISLCCKKAAARRLRMLSPLKLLSKNYIQTSRLDATLPWEGDVIANCIYYWNLRSSIIGLLLGIPSNIGKLVSYN
ncbi:uncharacterized protein CMU_005160 [Cryptosporidium muris RN66]|uniref:Phosphatidate cytidylyltransferase, mitochondrial n=1 Tax=Cryptosporidium muris (strain RN66) TaxID=441375 RepID=B6AH98_CRYMR|nr:uncharacterized protein CMU_005160 [Cryptosporidium muris RN66]EEA07593.1 hypothetical protein CMU_005160 [Cryptosporidium muris RN66]|eukprot:XP_002141942.1 hypothetical protein [Cryptosporidium muris RN66]